MPATKNHSVIPFTPEYLVNRDYIPITKRRNHSDWEFADKVEAEAKQVGFMPREKGMIVRGVPYAIGQHIGDLLGRELGVLIGGTPELAIYKDADGEAWTISWEYVTPTPYAGRDDRMISHIDSLYDSLKDLAQLDHFAYKTCCNTDDTPIQRQARQEQKRTLALWCESIWPMGKCSLEQREEVAHNG